MEGDRIGMKEVMRMLSLILYLNVSKLCFFKKLIA